MLVLVGGVDKPPKLWSQILSPGTSNGYQKSYSPAIKLSDGSTCWAFHPQPINAAAKTRPPFPERILRRCICAMPILSFGGDSCRSNASCGCTGPGAFLSRIRGGFRENPGQAATWHHSSTQEFSFLPSTDSTLAMITILLIVMTMERSTWTIILVKEMRSCQC